MPTVALFFEQKTLLLFKRAVVIYSVLSIEFKSADENVAKVIVNKFFSVLSMKGITFKDFYISLLTKMHVLLF